MNTNKIFFLSILITILTLPLAEAQYGYGYGNTNRYGRQRSAVPQADTTPKKEDPLTAEEIVAREMPKLSEALELNEFEHAVVSSILTKYVKQSIELQLLKLDPDKTREAMEKIRAGQKEELMAGLPEDKYNALVAIQQEGYKKKKKKKKKKKSKD
ncbi:hypothetical protein [Muriicola sp. Z0-33]|uniref:hypothetical protein n=1 Tax=Muriicola sp. Z0-33 TaxID=2816957 RepID=UPI00223771C7|nr:hypothetical protein [Muriicola sp. Z0-33]MCW5516623.1 hypothetical protein [Muriicola sp. Z0-33]